MGTAPRWPQAHTLAPNKPATVFVQWWSCGGPERGEAVRPTFLLRFGQGLTVTARARGVTPPFCGGLGGRRPLDVSPPLIEP